MVSLFSKVKKKVKDVGGAIKEKATQAVSKTKEVTSQIVRGAIQSTKDVGSGLKKINEATKPPLKEGQTLKTGTLPISPAFALSGVGTTFKLKSTSSIPNIGKTISEKTNSLSSAGRIIKNSKTIKKTTELILKAGKHLKDPAVITSTLIGAIGSYPFAGFIKEEALQTLSFGAKSAIENGDIEGAESALDQQRETLDPTMWDEIMGKIPYANVLNELKNFYDSAQTKLKIDEKIIEDMKIQQETGETDDEKWERVRQQEAEQEIAAIDYYNSERKKLLEWEREAKINARNEDAAFWRKERENQSKKEAEDRKAIADFWQAYKKEMQKIAENNRPSNLNFGLL